MKRFALLLCPAVVLTGCGGSPSSPVALPPVSPSPSTSTAGTSPAAPVEPSGSAPAAAGPLPAVRKPPEADAPTSDGAAAFVRYYFAVLSSAILNSDTRVLKGLSSPECEGCQRYINSVEMDAAKGNHVETLGLVLHSAVAPALEEGETTVLADFDAASFVVRDSAGRELTRNPGAKGLTGELRCVREHDAWLIMGFRLTTAG